MTLPLTSVTTWSRWSQAPQVGAMGGVSQASGATAVWPAANRAIYVPMYFDQAMTFSGMAIANGNAVSGNVDVGVYDASFTRLVSSGSTAQSGAQTMQSFTLAFSVGVGIYYFALACDNTTARIVTGAGMGLERTKLSGILQEASAFPLPATATPVVVSSAYYPLIGAVVV